MVAIAAPLKKKIERRSRRAWNYRKYGQSRSIHRVTDITDTQLKYRVPYTPDYYGKERVVVLLNPDNTITVDPPTTGLIDLLTRDDLKRIENHADIFHAYLRAKTVDTPLTVGKAVTSQYQVVDHAKLLDEIKADDRVYKIEGRAADVLKVNHSDILLDGLTVVEEIDLTKLGFTTALYDCKTKANVESLRKKKHLGRVRAYKYVTKEAKSPTRTGKEAITYEEGKDYEIRDADTNPKSNCHKGINLADIAWVKANANKESRLFAFEFEMADIAAIPTKTDGKFRVSKCRCVEELDPKTLKPVKTEAPAKPAPAPVAKPASAAKPAVTKKDENLEEIAKEAHGLLDRLFGVFKKKKKKKGN